MPQYLKVKVVANQLVAQDIYLLQLSTEGLAFTAQPGQFINIYFHHPTHLFPRPFSIAGLEADRLVILYKTVGCLTNYLASLGKGATLEIIGPLGNAFQLDQTFPVLLAGGVGLAPLLFLQQRLNELGRAYQLVIGARTASQLPLRDQIHDAVYLTDDGTAGQKGTVIDYLKMNYANLTQPMTVYACGPQVMLDRLVLLSQKMGFKTQLALERVMACGLGLCQGCAVPVPATGGTTSYKLVCKDGPVFKGEELQYRD